VKTFPQAVFTKWIDPLNLQLADAWDSRGHIIHGRGTAKGKVKFEVHWWEQKHKGLELYRGAYTLAELRAYANHLDHILKEINRFHGRGVRAP